MRTQQWLAISNNIERQTVTGHAADLVILDEDIRLRSQLTNDDLTFGMRAPG
jgi:hypothetical protein